MRLATGIAVFALLSSGAAAQNPAAQAPPTNTAAPDIPGVVKGGTAVEVIKDGFQGTEGPIAGPDGSLLFTETQASRITKIAPDNTISTFLDNTNGSNGLAFDARGRLYSVQTTPGSMRVGIIYPKGSESVLADSIDGKPFNRPNDLIMDARGGIYFSDFPFQAPPAGSQAPAPAVYYIPPGGKVMKVADGIERPNGLQVSKDGKTLYVNNSGEWMLAFDIQPDGTLTGRRNFARYQGLKPGANGVVTSNGDGLALDNEGRLYAATNVGVQVFDPKGAHLGTIPLSRAPQNLAFAGPDKRTLYVVGRGVAFKVQMLAQGIQGRAK
jgi:gluconolactonase